jgi:hypothetical protein
LQAKEIKERLLQLIESASSIDPNLVKRLEEINRWIKNVKPGSLTAKPLVCLFLLQIIQDTEAWLIFQSLPSPEEQLAALNALNPAVRYWYSELFPRWLSENDPRFYVWRQKLIGGEFGQEDKDLLSLITNEIEQRGGTFVLRYIADLSMATDIIVSSSQEKPLCIQLTSLSDEYSQQKLDNWENTLRFWKVERGLFLSYNPGASNFINQIVNITLYNSNNLSIATYLRFSL